MSTHAEQSFMSLDDTLNPGKEISSALASFLYAT